LRLVVEGREVAFHHLVVSPSSRSGEAFLVGMTSPVLDRGTRQSHQVFAHGGHAGTLHQTLGDLQHRGHVVRSEDRRRVVERLLFGRELDEPCSDRGRDQFGRPAVLPFEDQQRVAQVRGLAHWGERLEGVEGESAAHREERAACVEDQSLGLGNGCGHFPDGAITDRD